MISIKEAAQQAADFCQQLFPDAQDMLLEEVERDENKFWLITVSYLAPVAKQSGVVISEAASKLSQLFPRYERHYKSLKIDAETGEVLSMKIRELQS